MLRFNDTEKKAVQRSVKQFSASVEPALAVEPVLERPPVLTMPRSELEPLTFDFPQDRSGDAGRREPGATPTVVVKEDEGAHLPDMGVTLNFAGGVKVDDSSMLPLSRANLSYHRKVEAKRASGEDIRRNKRHKIGITCSKCRRLRDKENHSQYYGTWWCKWTSEFDSYESFKQDQLNKGKGKGKNKRQ